jgi:hypothetical protein
VQLNPVSMVVPPGPGAVLRFGLSTPGLNRPDVTASAETFAAGTTTMASGDDAAMTEQTRCRMLRRRWTRVGTTRTPASARVGDDAGDPDERTVKGNGPT